MSKAINIKVPSPHTRFVALDSAHNVIAHGRKASVVHEKASKILSERNEKPMIVLVPRPNQTCVY